MSSTITHYTGGGIGQLESLNQSWARSTAGSYPNLFPTLGKGQSPQIFWLGCCDSRVPESSLLGLLPGEVFVHRSIANLVNPQDISLPAALQYAVDHVKVNMIVICGHSGCGGVAGACASTMVGVPEVDLWLGPLRSLTYTYASLLAGKSSADQQTAIVKLNVQNSVAKISQIPSVAAGVSGGTLQVYGAIYDVGTGLLSYLSAADVAEPGPDPAYPEFYYHYWFHVTNLALGPQYFIDIQNAVVQCSGTGGYYPNQHWRWLPNPDGSFIMTAQGLPGTVATVNPVTLFISMAAPIPGGSATQRFRPTLDLARPEWSFYCDFLPKTYVLVADPATKNLKMSNSATGSYAAWVFNSVSPA